MWLFRIPLSFGQAIRDAGNHLVTPVRSGILDQAVPNGMEDSYSMRTIPNLDDGIVAEFSIRGLISEGSTTGGSSSSRGPSFVDSARYNGSISSIQMLLLLLALSSSTTLAALLSQDFKPLIGMLTLIVYMLIGLVVMIAFFKFRRRLVASGQNSDDSTDPERDDLTLIGLVIFYLLVCVLDMFHIIASLNCRDVWTSCGNRDIIFNFVVEIFFHTARIVYLGVKTTFCFAFHRSTFKDGALTRYGLMFLQAVNVSLWFDALIQESSELSGREKETMVAYRHECLLNGSNVSADVLQCLAHNNTLYSNTETIVTTICLPFTIEFTLLVGELLGFCFYHCGGHTPHNPAADQGKGLPNGQVIDSIPPGGIQRGHDEDIVSPDENSPLLRSTVDLHSPSSSSTLLIQLWTAVVIIINVLNCVFAFLCKMQSSRASSFKSVAFFFLFTFWVGMAVAVATGYYVSRSFRVRGRRASFSSMDYLLILTSFGPLAYNAFTCIAAYGHETTASVIINDNNDVTTSFYVTMQVFNAIQVHLQTTFSLFAARIAVDHTQRFKPEARVFEAVILYLAVSNGSLWLTGTFAGYEFGGLQMGDGLSLQAAYFGRGAWAIIYNVVVPMLLFYRFNSCLVFTRIYRRLRVR